MGLFKDAYFDYVVDKKEVPKEESIVFSIMCDFKARRGLKQAWAIIDDDTQEEIIQAWIDIVKSKL